MRITVESAEVATLKADGRPWDGPGGPRIPARDLPAFFALSLTRQLEVLVASGPPPDPPEVFVRISAHGRVVLETIDRSSFDPRWRDGASGEVDVAPGTPLHIQVWDRDLIFHDLIGELTTPLPAEPGPDGRWRLDPFGQVRALVLRLE